MSDYEEDEVQTLLSCIAGDALEAPLMKTESRDSAHEHSSLPGRRRTSKYLGVGSSNGKNQWQARIPIKGKVTHLGYYNSEEEAAKVYDRVCLSLNGKNASLNFPASSYLNTPPMDLSRVSREDLQRSLGVKPMDKSSRFRGVSKKKEKWEAKVMLNRKWAYRELFNSEEDAARAYDTAVRRLKPNEARAYLNFKDEESPKVHDRSHDQFQLLNQPSGVSQQDSNTPSKLSLRHVSRLTDEADVKNAGKRSGMDWIDSVPAVEHESGQNDHLQSMAVYRTFDMPCHEEKIYDSETSTCSLKDPQSGDLVSSLSSASPCEKAASLQDRCYQTTDKCSVSDMVENLTYVQQSPEPCRIAAQLSMPQSRNATVINSVGNDFAMPFERLSFTITTGLQRHSSLPISATGKLVTSRDEEILGSLEPVMHKLEKCNSLVAQEVLITRTMSADASMLRTTNSPFANPSYQHGCSLTTSGTAAHRSSSFTSGVGTSPNLRRRLAGQNRSPLGRCGSMGLISLLKFGKVGADEEHAQNRQKAWRIFSGCPLLTETVTTVGDKQLDQ